MGTVLLVFAGFLVGGVWAFVRQKRWYFAGICVVLAVISGFAGALRM